MYGGQLQSSMPLAQELDNVSIHQDNILEIQHNGPTCRFHTEQRGEFAYVVCPKRPLTANRTSPFPRRWILCMNPRANETCNQQAIFEPAVKTIEIIR